MLGKPSRVDQQVAILVVSLLFLSGLSVYFYTGFISRTAQHKLLRERADAIYALIKSENFSDAEIVTENGNFTLPAELDAKIKSSTDQMSFIAGTSRIYLCWRSDNANWIILPSGRASENQSENSTSNTTANYDIIEQEPNEGAQAYISEAFRSGDVTATPGLISTDYGRIWGFYYPLANAQETRTSVLAVEFASDAVSTGNLKILAGTILIILISSGAAISLAVWRFHTISNLSHRASYNIDTMTGFKSRNTFDLDVTNINSTRTYESLTIYYIDLNDLKKVNDTQGHNAGDEYLKIMADLTRDSFDAKDIIYRVGGDEFCVISFNHVRNLAREKTKYFLKNVGDYSVNSSKNYSAAIGFAIFDYSMDVDASSTRIRAEMIMYENKRRMKSGKELLLDDNPLIARQIANQWEHAARCDEHSIDT